MSAIPLYVHIAPSRPVIIVPRATRVVYCAQVNGVACEQRSLEGFLLPLPDLRAKVFDPRWWEGHLNRRGLESWAHIYDEMDGVFSDATHFEGVLTWENCD